MSLLLRDLENMSRGEQNHLGMFFAQMFLLVVFAPCESWSFVYLRLNCANGIARSGGRWRGGPG